MKKKIVLLMVVAVTLTAIAAGVFLGGQPAITSFHPTTNFFLMIMGSGTNAPYRLVNPSNTLHQLLALAEGQNLVTNGTLVSASNVLQTALVANDTTTSNGVAALVMNASNNLSSTITANDTTTSNGLFTTETTRNAGVSNGVVSLLVANDTTTSNGVVSLLVANDTTTSNGVVSLLVANDTTTSNGVATLVMNASNNLVTTVVANDTTTSNGLVSSQSTKQNGNINLTNLATMPPVPMYGAVASTDGTNALWTIDANGVWVVNEDWLGDVTSTTAGAAGNLPWVVGNTGTLPSLVAPITESGVIGYISCVSTGVSARSFFLGPSGSGMFLATNIEIFFLSRTRIGQTNITGDITTHRVGIGNSIGAGEWSSGIYTMVNTNANTNTYVFVTSRAGTRTITYSVHAANTNDAMSMGWMVTGFYLDRTGTNVIFYVGTSETNLTAVATNTSNIPNSQMVTAAFTANRIATSAGTVFRTNYCDWIRMWVRRTI